MGDFTTSNPVFPASVPPKLELEESARTAASRTDQSMVDVPSPERPEVRSR